MGEMFLGGKNLKNVLKAKLVEVTSIRTSIIFTLRDLRFLMANFRGKYFGKELKTFLIMIQFLRLKG